MRYEIRSMGLAEILDTGFRLLRNHFALLFGIGLAIYLPIGLLGGLLGTQIEELTAPGAGAGDEVDVALVGLAGLAAVVFYLVGFPFVSCAITHALGRLYLGREARLGDSFAEALRRFLPLAGTYLVYGLILVALYAALLVPGIVLGGAFLALAIVVAVLASLYLQLSFLLLVQVIVLEETAGVPALARSRELMSGHLLRGLGLFLVVGLVAMVLGVGVPLVLAPVPVLEPFGTALYYAAIFAYTSAVSVVFYFDLRSRKESFDLEHLARLVEERSEPRSRPPV